MAENKHSNHIKWSKKRTSIVLAIVLAGIGYLMLGVMLSVVGATAGYTRAGHFLDHTATIPQEESKLVQTCYFMRIKFVGSDQNGAELEVTEIPAECPPSHKLKRD